jgi:hypothetical protein
MPIFEGSKANIPPKVILKSSTTEAKARAAKTNGEGLPQLLPEGNHQTVNIWMIGIKQLENVHFEFLAHRSQSVGRFYPDKQALIQEFMTMLGSRALAVVKASEFIMVDARGPAATKPPREEMLPGHVGTHPVIVRQVLEHQEFINDIGRQLRDQWPRRPMHEWGRSIAILVFCQSGKHRSVAWSYLIHAFLVSMGYCVTVHQDVMNFEGTCGMYNCAECAMPIRHSAMHQAIVKLSNVQGP